MKTDLLAYLNNKRNLTAKVSEVRNRLKNKKIDRKRYWLLFIVIGLIIFTGGGGVSQILLLVEIAVIVLIINVSIQIISLKTKLKKEQNNREYLNGLADFPAEFYDYKTLGSLMYLIQVNRANTLQEAFNLVENMAYQDRQAEISKQNLAYTKKIKKSSGINNFLNTLIALAVWKNR